MPLAVGASVAVGGNVMKDAFGVIALVALLPPITIQILGLIYKIKVKRTEKAAAASAHDGVIEFDTIRHKIQKQVAAVRSRNPRHGKQASVPDYPDIIEFENEGRW